MDSLSAVQNSPALAQLLALQQTAQTSLTQTSSTTATSTSGTDTLSLSAAALQALQGLGTDPTQQAQSQTASTYTAQGHHHHHHHHGGAQAQPAGSSQPATVPAPNQVLAVDQAGSALLQPKA